MRRTFPAVILLLVLGSLIHLSGCGKEKCGCDSETKFHVDREAGELYMENAEYGYINALYIQGKFTLCNPEDVPEDIRDLAIERYDQQYPEPVVVYFSGEAKDDCYKLYNPYAYYLYDLVLIEIENAE
ncbi:MAG TPA: hypothetical protein ENF21_08170 [Bacteroidetes bacterium]|nr:hypothetical protein [Bacteroidota bacterium]